MKSNLDPRFPIQGSQDYDRRMYLRLNELFREVFKEIDKLETRVKNLENKKP